MSTLNRLLLASAIWLLATSAVGVLLGISSWGSGLALVLASAVPMVIARQYWRAPEPSLSQRIQRELR